MPTTITEQKIQSLQNLNPQKRAAEIESMIEQLQTCTEDQIITINTLLLLLRSQNGDLGRLLRATYQYENKFTEQNLRILTNSQKQEGRTKIALIVVTTCTMLPIIFLIILAWAQSLPENQVIILDQTEGSISAYEQYCESVTVVTKEYSFMVFEPSRRILLLLPGAFILFQLFQNVWRLVSQKQIMI